MHVLSVNLGDQRNIQWRGKTIQTGIFKSPVDQPILLEKENVSGDTIVDRRYHGGEYKACYLYGANHYVYWKTYYPEKDLPFGMFGENITLEHLDELQIIVGSRYRLGSALVQVTEPRQPCFKLGVRFEDQGILKRFIQSGHSGVYLKVLETGEVKKGDVMTLDEEAQNSLTIAEVYNFIYTKRGLPADIHAKVESNVYLRNALKEDILSKGIV